MPDAPNEPSVAEPTAPPQLERQTYLEHRKSLVELGVSQMASFDKTLLLLSTGALGASALFVDTFVGDSRIHNQTLLAFAWGLFATTMLANLLSYLTSWWDTDIERRALDCKYTDGDLDRPHKNPARTLTLALNVLALVFFAAGIITLLIFSYGNL